MDDHRRHFDFLLRAFMDKRYLRIDDKPVFVIYRSGELPDSIRVTDFWRDLAVKAGLPGLFLIAENALPIWNPKEAGFDSVVNMGLPPRRTNEWASGKIFFGEFKICMLIVVNLPTIHPYSYLIDHPKKRPVWRLKVTLA